MKKILMVWVVASCLFPFVLGCGGGQLPEQAPIEQTEPDDSSPSQTD